MKESNKGNLQLIEFSKLDDVHQRQAKAIFTASFSADFRNMNCTGTYISNEGHFLTAEHCIQGCFQFSDDNWEKYMEYESFKGPDLKYGVQQWLSLRRFRDTVITDGILCDLEVNGERRQAKLVTVGKGAVNPFTPDHLENEKLLAKYKEWESQGIGWPSSDFAILQLIDKPKTPCLKLRNRLPQRDELLKAVSYACIASYRIKENTKGEIPFYTEGVLASPDMFLSLDGKNIYSPRNTLNSFVSNIDAEGCSSGSAIVGADGAILGVMSMVQDRSDRWGPRVKLLRASSSIGIIEALHKNLDHEIVCDQ